MKLKSIFLAFLLVGLFACDQGTKEETNDVQEATEEVQDEMNEAVEEVEEEVEEVHDETDGHGH